MIITKTVKIKISVSNMRYWRELGYKFENPAPRWGIIPEIEVKIEHLKGKSCVYVECSCDRCKKIFKNRISRNTDICYVCVNVEKMKGNVYGRKNRGKPVKKMRGENHPRWNPNKSQYREFSSKVRDLSEIVYRNNIELINPDNYPRTLCGVEGGYQLDHIISIKYGFDNGMTPEELSEISNLQILPWKDNRDKGHK